MIPGQRKTRPLYQNLPRAEAEAMMAKDKELSAKLEAEGFGAILDYPYKKQADLPYNWLKLDGNGKIEWYKRLPIMKGMDALMVAVSARNERDGKRWVDACLHELSVETPKL